MNFLIDTSIWVDLFKGSDLAKEKVLPLIQQGRAYICGVVIYELLVGVKRPEQRKELLTILDALNYLELDKTNWLRTAEMFHELKGRGIVLPFSDILLSSLAEAHQCEIITRDNHFSYIKKVQAISLDEIRI